MDTTGLPSKKWTVIISAMSALVGILGFTVIEGLTSPRIPDMPDRDDEAIAACRAVEGTFSTTFSSMTHEWTAQCSPFPDVPGTERASAMACATSGGDFTLSYDSESEAWMSTCSADEVANSGSDRGTSRES